MTTTQKIAYGFFGQAVILLLLYGAAGLVSAAKFLPPDPLAATLPYHQIAALSNILLHLAVVSGLLGGGIYAAASMRDNCELPDTRTLRIAAGGWTLLLALATLAGIFGLAEGRAGLELPLLLDIAQGVIAILVIEAILRDTPLNPVMLVWTVGMALVVLATVVGFIPSADFVQERALRALAVGLRDNMGYTLAALALGSWLARRVSTVGAAWADESVLTLAGLLSLAGAGVTLASLYPLYGGGWIAAAANTAAIGAPVLLLIAAAHHYKVLANRNQNATLAAHWLALGVLCWLLGLGILGGLLSAPVLRQWTAGTRLADAQSLLTLLAPIAVVLGVINQAASELHGVNGRITGYIPFWLVAFGGLASAFLLAGAGLVQVYLERVMSVGYLDAQTMLAPVFALALVGTMAGTLGVGVYALGFWLRRPPIHRKT